MGPVEPYGALCKPLEPCGALWGPMEPHMEPYGAPREIDTDVIQI